MYIEVASAADLAWQKSSFSNAESNCVEAAVHIDRATAVRDSKDPHGPALIFPTPAWHSFIAGIQQGTLPTHP
ncbi:DUF397 domain-containing protein [Kitasatospora sp. NBC_01287]|uniref:DUF397 domain-containing protein n=1 Tax=Kitasatospora sp. NBC_01287 TaxID=2903573 RepID=UPI002252934B|nr:DUF397 domain-containing protein [Kitasatospora sp. NBC_01287]MCX4750264.1 DUF397 domain-containing protein [Kitasatospora sp. NBC_01287]